MDGSAAERSTTPGPDDSASEWRDRASVAWRRGLLFLAHWRLRVLVAFRLGRQTLGRVWRAAMGRLTVGATTTTRESGDSALLPSVIHDGALPVSTDGDRSPGEERGPTASLPGPSEPRRELPAGDGLLDVERTPSRLIISDPAADDAYLASTYWVEIEE
jgi:hypothetical protein